LRELLQNAADASASKVTVRFETMPSAHVPLPQSRSPSALLQHTTLHHTLKRLVVTNNGQSFGPNDWSRLKRIAEGNPDETKIGAFGVGFYSVFSDCEEPFVSSGSEAMAFYWKGNSLFTKRLQLPEAQSSPDTTFLLDYRNTTSSVPSMLPLAQFLASSLTFVGLTNIELWLDDWKLLSLNKLVAPGHNLEIPRGLNTKTHEGIMRVGTVIHETAQLDAKWLSIVGWKPKAATTQTDSSNKGASSAPSLRTFFSKFASGHGNNAAAAKAAQEERAAQEAIAEDLTAECTATVFLHVNTATITTSVSKSFGAELERATKKPAPKTTKIAVLTASHEDLGPEEVGSQSPSKLIDIFGTVLPTKLGRVYIGFPTHQTTGLAAHVSAPSVIPTVERESIDLNARWVRTWNQEMLRAVGIVTRIAWSGAITSIRDGLARQIQISGGNKVRPQDVDKIMPQAINLLNHYTFRESTPSSQVGTLVEEAFWTCNNSSSIEILSSRGILPSQNVRLATDELSFVEGIPVVPAALFEKANGFVKRLVDYGIITEVTTGDIKKELEAQALNVNQMIEFLRWLAHKVKINEVEGTTINSLLAVTVVNDEEDGRVWLLSQIEHFINPSRIPGTMPTPPNTLPFKFTKGIEKPDLQAIGWDDLTIVPWLRFLVENVGARGGLSSDQDIVQSPDFAGQVLAVVSKQWDGLSQSSRATVLDILSSRTTIPTKMGMKKPTQAYFPSVKLFEDLPIVTVHSVKEKLLSALGVRKTIELDLIFQRLLNTEKSESPSAWSHVDLIKYLASVRGDIPNGDIRKLHDTPICTVEGATSGEPRYRVSELYEPNEELRSLGLKLIHWPGVYREGSEEGRFLRTLGIRTYPTVPELVNIVTMASSQNNLTLRDKAFRYMINNYHKHGYIVQEFAKAPVPFLPLENKATLATPSRCFTNEKVSMMGFDVLKKELHVHSEKFGVQANPPIEECATWLVNNKPNTNREARQLFEYFASRVNEISGRSLSLLSQADIVPVATTVSSAEKSKGTRHLAPNMCFLGTGEQYAAIFDYVDFGPTANTFLLRCGSKHEPTTNELAWLVVREPARIFSTFGSAEKYLDLLTTLARSTAILKKDKELVKAMRKSTFLLAYIQYPSSKADPESNEDDNDNDEDESIRSYQLATAEQILIADDVINYNLFKFNVLAAPPEEDLENFYANLGARLLSQVIDEQPRVGAHQNNQASAAQLKKLVLERIKLFYHDVPRDLIKREPAWLEKNLNFVAVTSLSVRKTLKNTNISHTEAINATFAENARDGKVIYFLPGARDYFHISQALLTVCLTRSKPQQASILTTLLENDLHKLRARGYDVARILKRKAAEARVAEEKRQQQLLEEQQRMEEAETVKRERQLASGAAHAQESTMPGFFPDSPDHSSRNSKDVALPPRPSQDDDARRPRGLFSALQRTFGVDPGRRSSTQTPQLPQEPQLPPYINDVVSQRPVKGPQGRPPGEPVSASNLQKNLINAISASRAHNSSAVSSRPVENEVKETQTFCDTKPGQNISFFGEAAFGIRIYLSKTMDDKPRFMAANSSALNAFAGVMVAVADALHLSRQSLHLFHDGNSTTIAFNQDGALFFNYRYFEDLHLADVQQGKSGEAIIYWFVTTCHELAHNIVSDHSAAHSYYT
jgi:hypothetical protein